MSRLTQSQIDHYLALQHFTLPLAMHFLDTIDSTSQYLKSLPKSPTPIICCAEEQTSGRGRFGRSWYSPAFENIYFSMRISCNKPVSELSGMGIVTAIAIVKMLQLETGLSLSIKWPNDVLWNEKKLSGCLIELVNNDNQSTDLIIGIGINVNSNLQPFHGALKPFTSLFDITHCQYDRNRLIAMLIYQLLEPLNQFFLSGLNPFQNDFKALDGLFGKPITVSNASGTQSGIAHGIDKNGHLLLIDSKGVVHTLFSGTTTLSITNPLNRCQSSF